MPKPARVKCERKGMKNPHESQHSSWIDWEKKKKLLTQKLEKQLASSWSVEGDILTVRIPDLTAEYQDADIELKVQKLHGDQPQEIACSDTMVRQWRLVERGKIRIIVTVQSSTRPTLSIDIVIRLPTA